MPFVATAKILGNAKVIIDYSSWLRLWPMLFFCISGSARHLVNNSTDNIFLDIQVNVENPLYMLNRLVPANFRANECFVYVSIVYI